MNGKNSNNRFPLGPRVTGAALGLALCGVVAAAAHGVVTPDSESDPGTRSGDAIAAAELLHPKKTPPKKTSERPAADSSAKRSDDEPDARSKVITRAKSWNPHTSRRVPYSQTKTYKGYRTDCSGYVAMALGLPGPGPNTVGFTSSKYTKRIKMSQLKKGDLVMDAQGTNTTRHVVIFEKWANSAHTSYWAYEQRGRYGTDYRKRNYGLTSGSEYKAYRPKNL